MLAGPLLVGVLLLAACGGDDADPAAQESPTVAEAVGAAPADTSGVIDGVDTFDGLSQDHVSATEVDYPLEPPVGGEHNQQWQACGLYTVPVPSERVVHSMEHGAVWIAHQASLTASDFGGLAEQVQGETHLLLAPYPALTSPVVLSAWGAQLRLDDPTDPRIASFIDTYVRRGPEAGTPCSQGGVGSPPDNDGGPLA